MKKLQKRKGFVMIDARGRSCPEPVIMIKQAMAFGEAEYKMIVDNRVSLENVTRFAGHHGYKVTYREKDGEYTLDICKE